MFRVFVTYPDDDEEQPLNTTSESLRDLINVITEGREWLGAHVSRISIRDEDNVQRYSYTFTPQEPTDEL